MLAGDSAALAAFPEVPSVRLNPQQSPFQWDPIPTQINQVLDVIEQIIRVSIPHLNEQALIRFLSTSAV